MSFCIDLGFRVYDLMDVLVTGHPVWCSGQAGTELCQGAGREIASEGGRSCGACLPGAAPLFSSFFLLVFVNSISGFE